MLDFRPHDAAITAVAETIIDVLKTNAQAYPVPPVAPSKLKAMLDSFNALRTSGKATETSRRAVFDELSDALRRTIRYQNDWNRRALVGVAPWNGPRFRAEEGKPRAKTEDYAKEAANLVV